jgi:hypothetical protein
MPSLRFLLPVLGTLSLACLIAMYVSLPTPAQFWPVAEYPPLLLFAIVALVSILPPRAHEICKALLIGAHAYATCMLPPLVGIAFVSADNTEAMPTHATQLALIDIGIVMFIVQPISQVLRRANCSDCFVRIMGGQLNTLDRTQLSTSGKPSACVLAALLTTLAASTAAYCVAAHYMLEPSDSLLPSGNMIGYVTCARMILTVCVPLIQMHDLLASASQSPALLLSRMHRWAILALLTFISTYILSSGVCLMLITNALIARPAETQALATAAAVARLRPQANRMEYDLFRPSKRYRR